MGSSIQPEAREAQAQEFQFAYKRNLSGNAKVRKTLKIGRGGT